MQNTSNNILPSFILKLNPPFQADVKLAHRLLLRQLTPSVLERWCPTTQHLGDAVDRVLEAVASAERFVLDLYHVDHSHWHYENDAAAGTVSVGFHTETPPASWLLHVDFSSKDFEAVRRSGVSARLNSGRRKDVPSEAEVKRAACAADAGWGFFRALVDRLDASSGTCKE